jgi:hypothetical protein
VTMSWITFTTTSAAEARPDGARARMGTAGQPRRRNPGPGTTSRSGGPLAVMADRRWRGSHTPIGHTPNDSTAQDQGSGAGPRGDGLASSRTLFGWLRGAFESSWVPGTLTSRLIPLSASDGNVVHPPRAAARSACAPRLLREVGDYTVWWALCVTDLKCICARMERAWRLGPRGSGFTAEGAR